jgi:hypothetical protein
MKPEVRIAALFIFPVIAVAVCAAMTFTLPAKRAYAPERPQFLDYIERLGVADASPRAGLAAEPIRNVFSYEEPKEGDQQASAQPAPAPAQPEPQASSEEEHGDSLGSYEPVWVSMIVEDGRESFSVINGRTMRIGDRGDSFTLTAIRKGSVIIRRTDGTEEIIHVKAF